MSNTRFPWMLIIALMLSIIGLEGRGRVFAAATESTIWSFDYADGVPEGRLIEVGGKLYGTTFGGGSYNGGTVFQLTPPAPGQTGWSESLVWSFDYYSYDGANPAAGVIEAGGKLYGTTAFGGANSNSGLGNGTVFELAPPPPGQTAWLERVLLAFPDPNQEDYPVAGLISVHGKLYGTDTGGGATGQGAVFEVTP